MKKCILTTILLTMLVACSVDNVESDVTPTETESTTENPPSILGKTYLRSGYIIDTAADVNGDGVFSTDLMQEQLCYDLLLSFGEDFRVLNPTFDGVSLYVDDDGNGNLSQRMVCSHGDGTPNTYKQVDNEIQFYYGEELQFTGTLSEDETTITFTFPNELLFGFNFFTASNQILFEDGTVEGYQGKAVAIYTLQ